MGTTVQYAAGNSGHHQAAVISVLRVSLKGTRHNWVAGTTMQWAAGNSADYQAV